MLADPQPLGRTSRILRHRAPGDLRKLFKLHQSPPTKTLPTEILQYIFVIAHRDWPLLMVDLQNRSHRTTDMFALSRICHLWRSILVAMPELWSTFRVEIDPPIISSEGYTGTHRFYLTRLQMIMDRCGTRPIEFEYNGSYFGALLPRLISYSDHWKVAKFKRPCTADTGPLLTQMMGRVRQLRKLELRTFDGINIDLGALLIEAPKLRTLIVHGTDPLNLQAPWSQLTFMSFDFCPHNPSDLLRLLHNLRSLAIRRRPGDFAGHFDQSRGDSPALIPCLRTLSVDYGEDMCLLDFMITPVLEQLSLKFRFRPQAWETTNNNSNSPEPPPCLTPIISRLIRRSACQIRSLHINLETSSKFLWDDIYQVLETVPTLTSLTLNGDSMRGILYIIDSLCSSIVLEQCPLPNLENFNLILPLRPPPARIASIVSLITGFEGKRLKHFVLSQSQDRRCTPSMINTGRERIKDFDRFRDRGMDIQVHIEGWGMES